MGGGPTGPLLQHTRLHQQTEIAISVTNVCPGWAGASSKAVVARPALVGSPSSPPEECCFCPWRLRGTANPYVSPHPLPPPINPQAYPDGHSSERQWRHKPRRTPDVCLSLRRQVYHCFSVTESPGVSPAVSLSDKPKKQERLHNQHIMHCHTDTQCPLIRCIRAAEHNRPRGAGVVGLPTSLNWSRSTPCVPSAKAMCVSMA